MSFSPALTLYCLPPVLITAYMAKSLKHHWEKPRSIQPGPRSRSNAPARAAPARRPRLPAMVCCREKRRRNHSSPMSTATLEPVQRLIADEMHAVDEVIRRRLHSDVVLVRQVAEYIINGGGKRLRPALVILAAGACGYSGTRPVSARRGGRVHPHGHAAARRCGRRVAAAPRARDRQFPVRQPGQRAGRRFSVLARLPDDGRARRHAGHAGARRRHQHHRRGRGAAAAQLPRCRAWASRTICT